MRKQFVKTVEKIIEDDTNSVLLLGDIGVFGFRNSLQKYPSRAYNIGILEQSTVSLAAGLSKNNMIPIIHTIAPFIVERAYEQIKVDFGYQNLNGNFVSIGASYDYASLGSTHHCPGDVPILNNIPNLQIIVPGNSQEFDKLFNLTYKNGSPTYFRLSEYENKTIIDVEPNKANLIKKGTKATLICIGNMLDSVIEATKDMDITILYYTTVKPFDCELLKDNFNENLIVCEPYYEGNINFIINKTFIKFSHRILNIGVPNIFLENYGKKEEHDKKLQLDSEGIKKKIIEFLC